MHKLFSYHPRLWISMLAGIAIFFLMPARASGVGRILAAYNCGVDLYLLLIFIWMRSLSAAQICSRFVEEDESAPLVLAIVVAASLLSLIAIVAMLLTVRQLPDLARLLHMGLAALTVVNSWALVPTVFSTLYAGMYYSAAESERPLQFPQTPQPVFWDFAYFSFTVAAACQTSDVLTTGHGVRKIVILQTVISFLFNAAILGFAINVTAGLIGSG